MSNNTSKTLVAEVHNGYLDLNFQYPRNQYFQKNFTYISGLGDYYAFPKIFHTFLTGLKNQKVLLNKKL